MPPSVLSTAARTGAAAVGAASILALIRLRASRQAFHPRIAEYAAVCAAFPGLAHDLAPLVDAIEEHELSELLARLTRVAELDAAGGPTAQWHLHREGAEAVRGLRAALRRALASGDYRAALACREDVLPQLERHLETILHNHLLAHHNSAAC